MTKSFKGFSVRGFRSFYHVQQVALTGQLNVLAGVNNSGKSNVLLAAEHILSPFSRSRNQIPQLDELDRSQVAEGDRPLPLVIGIATNADELSLESLASARGRMVPKGTQGEYVLKKFVELATETLGANNDGLLWLNYVDENSLPTVDPEQVKAVADPIDQSGQAGLFNQATLDILGENAGRTDRNVAALLNQWFADVTVPEVVLVPAQRQITHDAQVSPDIRSLSGVGFTGLLQALQAPSANRHRQDRARFQKINEFLRRVLEDDSAAITIPHDSSTVHVSLTGRVLPLANLGSGIEQIVLLATLATQYDARLFCIEEPELHLHPVLLRKLATYLLESTTNQYLLSTHSAHLLDSPTANIIGVTYEPGIGTLVRRLLGREDRAAISRRLGYRASDLVQANSIVWVEGPSDRILVKSWIAAVNPDLTEGIHYSVLFYGGRLLSHFTVDEIDSLQASTDDFISMLDINRRMAILIDSDRRNGAQALNATKRRLIEGFECVGGIAWVTAGKEVENYIPVDTYRQAVKQVHPTAEIDGVNLGGQFSSRFTFVKSGGPAVHGKIRSADKVRIAATAISLDSSLWDVLDLDERVRELVAFIESSNDIASVIAPPTSVDDA